MKVLNISLILFSIVSCAQLPTPTTSEPLPHRASYDLPQLQLDGSEVPMMGKDSRMMVVPGGLEIPERTIWLVGMSSKVFDDEQQTEDSRFFCHTHVGENGYDSYRTMRFMGNHAGGQSLTLPNGFAVPMLVSKQRPLNFYGMAADYSKTTKLKKVHFQLSIDYYENEQAQRLGLKELDFQYARIMWPPPGKKNNEHVHHHAHRSGKSIIAETRAKFDCDHWMAAPGQTVFSTPANDQLSGLKRGNIRVHHIHLHVHPGGEWGEIFDKTLQRTVWRGRAKTNPRLSVLESVEHYSSPEGFVLHRDHEYELRMLVNNKSSTPLSSMLTMRIFYRPE